MARNTNDLFDHMRQSTDQMQGEYDRIQKRASEDPGTAGDNGEENWKELLRRWLPPSYQIVTKGRIMNIEGKCGPQVDLLVLSPAYPPGLLDRKEYLLGGVVAAFECKLTLRAAHIHEAVENAVTIRRLEAARRHGTPYKELYSPICYGLLAHSHVWQGKESAPLDNLENHLWEETNAIVKRPYELLDLVCVSDLTACRTSRDIHRGELFKGFWRTFHDGKYDPTFLAECDALGGMVETAYLMHFRDLQETNEQKERFTPIGSFISSLLKHLAWDNPELQPIARYFELADVQGNAHGYRKAWSYSVLSDFVRETLENQTYPKVQSWNEWSSHF